MTIEPTERARLAERVRRQPALPKARLVAREEITPDLMVIKLLPEIPFAFRPGQYCTLGLDGIERAYSIASAPHEPLLEIFVELVPEGELTPRLWQLPVGASVTIRPKAKGLFLMDERYPNQLMVATVTGIAPFISIIRSYIHSERSGHRFHVLHGASYQDEFVYAEEMREFSQRCPGLVTYVSTVSRPHDARNARWSGPVGRVNLIVEDYLERFGLDRPSTLVYACGHPGMIQDVQERLPLKGFKVKAERFWV